MNLLWVIISSLVIGVGSIPLEAAPMKLETSAFREGEPIPKKYTCQGENVSPPLSFFDVPQETVAFAIIVNDPDAHNGSFFHWVVWNIPGAARTLSEGNTLGELGINGFGGVRYDGPCPPPGKLHRYIFTLYALDSKLLLPEGSTAKQLLEAVKGHVLDSAEMMGTFRR